MPNNSATGGPLAPDPAPAPLEGQALLTFLQQWVVNLTGLDGTLVRPRWLPEPPNIPAAGTCWAAIGAGRRVSDTYPYTAMAVDPATGTQFYQLVRMEELELLCSFYDLGSTGQADYYAALFRDGSAIGQNREYLRTNAFAFVSCGDLTPVPSLLKERWLYRVDVPVTLRRQINRNYPILTVETADIDLKVNDAGDGIYEKIITVSQP